ncbi:sodium/calcium exchanger 1 [Plakobranchus ocellatus]|uniref:Sodium/calcium exchanger 1 n=1 Tax=Plakobranchus ocellatus TaxID=259542 RepID=A0AAV4BE04_9GAST|nr:sodium/calcium exchanger 1 [Plakobranchus ocellatus]
MFCRWSPNQFNHRYNNELSLSLALNLVWNFLDLCMVGWLVVFSSTGKGEDVDSGAVVNSEDDRMAEMGKPRLGELTKTTIRIKESQEFKSTVDKLLKKANVSLVVGTSSWREQFVEAITVSAVPLQPPTCPVLVSVQPFSCSVPMPVVGYLSCLGACIALYLSCPIACTFKYLSGSNACKDTHLLCPTA